MRRGGRSVSASRLPLAAVRETAAAICLLLGVVPLLFGCSTNPVTGERQVILMSEAAEKRIDERAAQEVERTMGLVEDPALSAYIDKIGQALAVHSPRQDVRYRFHVIKMDEPNAFALPGGNIYISRGLLALANSEAEIANVLGHEIGHVAARHAAQRDTLVKTVNVLAVLGMIGAVVGGARPNGNGGPVGTPGLYGYSRGQESQADEIGQDLAVKAGVDPMGMSRMMRGLDSYGRIKQGYSRDTNYFDTHPAARERAAETATAAQVRRWKPGFAVARTRADFLAVLDGLALGDRASEGVIKDRNFYHPDLGIGLRFPQGWEILNTNAAVFGVAPQMAAVLALELQGEGDDPVAAARGFGQDTQVHLKPGQALQIGGFDAYRASGEIPTPAGPQIADVTWIAFEGRIYRLSGFTLRAAPGNFAGVFHSFPRTFHRLTESERADIDELRLRVVEAREGETLAQLSERTANTWKLAETAMMNQLAADARLEAGYPVKIAVREPYVSAAGETDVPPGESTPPSPSPTSPTGVPGSALAG